MVFIVDWNDAYGLVSKPDYPVNSLGTAGGCDIAMFDPNPRVLIWNGRVVGLPVVFQTN